MNAIQELSHYVLYDDPGHAWLRVTRKELEELNILKSISIYSYEQGQFVYLEEDCDLSIFLKAKGVEYHELNASEFNDDSNIVRSMQPLKGGKLSCIN